MSSRPRFVYFRRARFRLTLYYTAIQLLFLAALGGFLYYRNYRSMLHELERFLKDETRDVMAYLPQYLPAIAQHFETESQGERYYELSFRLLDPQGKVLARSRSFRDSYTEPIHAEALQAALNGDSYAEFIQLPGRPSRHLLVTRSFRKGEVRYIVQTLAYLEPLDKLSARFRQNIYVAIPLFVLISWVAGYTLARKVLRPVHEMARTARHITSTSLNQRLVRTNSGDEFDVLAATLNDMIGRLEESFELLRQFAADAAHELRTPLTIVKGEAEVALRSNSASPETYRAALESTIRECDRMIGIITNLLLLSQADTDAVQLEKEPFRLDDLLTEVAETFRVLAEEAGLTLEVGQFPSVVVDGDRSRLHELFANLLDNAVKYTPTGGRITITCRADPEEVHVDISDTGIGIPEDEQAKIFDRFYRVDRSRSRETGGSGLGLSIARWIATAHGGRIEVHSAPGSGSTFTVSLPRATTAEPAAGETTPTATTP